MVSRDGTVSFSTIQTGDINLDRVAKADEAVPFLDRSGMALRRKPNLDVGIVMTIR